MRLVKSLLTLYFNLKCRYILDSLSCSRSGSIVSGPHSPIITLVGDFLLIDHTLITPTINGLFYVVTELCSKVHVDAAQVAIEWRPIDGLGRGAPFGWCTGHRLLRKRTSGGHSPGTLGSRSLGKRWPLAGLVTGNREALEGWPQVRAAHPESIRCAATMWLERNSC